MLILRGIKHLLRSFAHRLAIARSLPSQRSPGEDLGEDLHEPFIQRDT